VIDRGGKEIYCAGALAQLFEALGGVATVIGKPFPDAYRHALAKAEALTGMPLASSDVLAIGDSFRTDIAGAEAFGAQSLFIAAGIHAAEFLAGDQLAAPGVLEDAVGTHGFKPDFIMARLA
jgi:ribonucleotide monophosphatase NagD (HAD superfamily)